MPRNFKAGETMKRAKARRQSALDRTELRGDPTPRVAAASPMSMGVKTVDPETRRLIDEALARRGSST